MKGNDSRRVAEEGELFCTHIGGAATLEGVMMRGKKSWAVAVRREDGTMYVEEHDLPDPSLRPAWMRWPIVRGCVSFAESMMLSYQAMQIAADHVYVDEVPVAVAPAAVSARPQVAPQPTVGPVEGSGLTEEAASTKAAGSADGSFDAGDFCGTDSAEVTEASTQTESGAPQSTTVPEAAPSAVDCFESSTSPAGSEPLVSPLEMLLSAGVGVLLGLVLFVAVPVFVANLLVGQLTEQNSLVWNLVEAALRIVILIAYVGGIAVVPDIRRLYGYHGAEHQSIHCFEHGLPLTPENAAKFSRLHVRCGTAFLVMTIAVAIVVHSVVPVAAWADALGISGVLRSLFVFATRMAMLPLVAGLSYEITVKWAGAHPNNPLVKLALWPGLQMQRLTTRTADPGMLECAIEALKRVDAREHRTDPAAHTANNAWVLY